jgi:hypothetical protein
MGGNGLADRELENMTIEYQSRGGVGTTAYVLIETTDGWYRSNESNFTRLTGAWTTWTNPPLLKSLKGRVGA